MTVSGFLAVRTATAVSGRSYDIRIAGTGESFPLASGEFVTGWGKEGSFYFNHEAVQRGNEILTDPHILSRDIIVVDEVGIFELDGKVWADAVSKLAEMQFRVMIWVVRDTLVKTVIQRWGLVNPVIIDINKVSLSDAEKMIRAQF